MYYKTSKTEIDLNKVTTKVKYPWATCAVGEGWIIPAGKTTLFNVRVASYKWNKKLNAKFLVHKYEDGRIHVWRQS